MKTYGIAVNSLNVPHHTGVEKYLVALLRELQAIPLQPDERVVLYTAKVPHGFPALAPGWEWRVLSWPLPKGWTHGRLSWELLCNPPDVFFNPTHEVPIALRARTKVVTTVHDLAFKRVPGLYERKAGRRQEWAIRRVVRRADYIVAISETTKNDLRQLYGVDGARVAVAPHGIDTQQFAPPLEASVLRRHKLIEGKYMLFVGRLEGKKNVATLVRAFAEFHDMVGGHPLQLVLAGGWGFGQERILAALRDAGDSVRTLGYVDDADLPSLYKGALAFCFPSYYEGFGIPVLEAFAAGTPVIASTTPALREVAGDAAMFASPDDAHAWAVALKAVAFDAQLRERLAKAGAERVAAFTWRETARRTWEALRAV